MKWAYRKLNNRNQLYGIMTYQLTCSLPEFFNAREWCWEQFGPGIEYEHFLNHTACTGQIKRWAWDCNKFRGAAIDNGKLYLPDDTALMLFKNTWH